MENWIYFLYWMRQQVRNQSCHNSMSFHLMGISTVAASCKKIIYYYLYIYIKHVDNSKIPSFQIQLIILIQNPIL